MRLPRADDIDAQLAAAADRLHRHQHLLGVISTSVPTQRTASDLETARRLITDQRALIDRLLDQRCEATG